jgi:hypothetical protein
MRSIHYLGCNVVKVEVVAKDVNVGGIGAKVQMHENIPLHIQ